MDTIDCGDNNQAMHTKRAQGIFFVKGAKVDVNRYWRDGYLLLRNLFDPEEFGVMRERILEAVRRIEEEQAPVTDALSDSLMHPFVYDDRLIAVARRLLNRDDVTYFGDGSFAVLGRNYDPADAVGWHRDNTDRYDLGAPDWQTPYTLIRFGFYLQDHQRRSGGLMVRRKSHNIMMRGLQAQVNERYLNTGPGDVVVWNMRLQHAGVGRCLRGIPGVALGPWKQRRIPEFLQAPYTAGERAAFWVSYGIDDAHLKRHCDYLVTRTERLGFWKESHYTPEALALCDEVGLGVVNMPDRIRSMLAAGEPVGQHAHHYQFPY